LVALAIFMRLSLTKAAHVAASSAAWQEIRVRSGRDDKFVEPWTGVHPLDNWQFPSNNEFSEQLDRKRENRREILSVGTRKVHAGAGSG
jgi:hypothetical protein